MSDLDKAVATQIANIQKRTGKSLEELSALIRGCGLTKHGEIRDMLKRDLGMGHGDANTLVHVVLKSGGASAEKERTEGGVLDEIYAGPKAALRPVHDRIMEEIKKLGDFEIAPKKGYLSLRRKKQFAMVGPSTNSKIEVGLNVKELPSSDRLTVMPPKGMCNYKTRLSELGEVDAELIGWIKSAYDSAG